MWKYCDNISQLRFFIFYIISLFSHFISYIRFFFFFLLHTRLSLSHLPLLFFLFLLPSQKCSQSHSIFIFSLALALCFFFFFPSYIHVCPYLFPPFLSFSPSFKNVLASALILSFFFLQLSLSIFLFFIFYFFCLLDSETAVVFVKRVGRRGHLCNSMVRAVFSPQSLSIIWKIMSHYLFIYHPNK